MRQHVKHKYQLLVYFIYVYFHTNCTVFIRMRIGIGMIRDTDGGKERDRDRQIDVSAILCQRSDNSIHCSLTTSQIHTLIRTEHTCMYKMLAHTFRHKDQAQRSGVLLNTPQSKRDIKVPLREFSIDDKKMSSLLLTRRNLFIHTHTHTHCTD